MVGDIQTRIKESLEKSEYWTPKTKVKDNYISNLKCPECGDKTAWAYSNKPWAIICNRKNECGISTKTLKLFPEIIQNIEKEYSPTKEDPHRPATVYLHSRGLVESLEGLKYEYRKNIRGTGQGGVMFPVAKGVYNGRIFNPPHGEGKTHNQGSTSGMFWRHPSKPYIRGVEIFITEGIINALSLWEMGFQAIAVLSAGQDPVKLDLSEFDPLSPRVLAFDNDAAGHNALRKWKEHFPNVTVLLPKNGDWNDFILFHKDNAKEDFDKQRAEFECLAKLALASDANKYATTYQMFYKRLPGLFPFKGCYYYLSENKDSNNVHAHRVSNFTIEVDHYQLDDSNAEEPVNKYYLKIKPSNSTCVSCAVSANEIASPGGFTQMFLTRARVLWEGDKWPSLALTRQIVEAKSPIVRQLQVTGYDKESGFYIFKDFAINRKGETILPNEKGFFESSQKKLIRPAQYSAVKPFKGIEPQKIYKLIYQAWGNQGLTAIAWMVAGWFVHRIKEKIGFFPFLSFCGDTQTGKTALTRFLNSLQCFDEEGLPMRKVNTGKGEIRKLAQRASLFRALLEGNNEDNIKFDLDALLTLYNDNPLQVRAIKSNDIQTVEIPFQSSLLFVQNCEPFKSKAQKERVVSVQFKDDALTTDTAQAFNKLIQIPISEMAYFFPFIMKHRETFESKWFDAFQQAKNDIREAIGDARITENHALILTFHRLLDEVLQINYDLKPFIEEIGKLRQKECSHRSESVADIFFDYLEEIISLTLPENQLFIDKEGDRLYVNLKEVLKKFKDKGFPFQVSIKDLQSSLEQHPAWIKSGDGKKHHWFTKIGLDGIPEKKQLRAWVFYANKLFCE